MSEFSRRHAFKAMAVGAVAVAGSIEARAEDSTSSLDAAVAAARAVARRGDRIGAHTVAAVRVFLCRSWDRQVYFHVDDLCKGFAALDEAGFAIAAACQAAGRPVALQYLDHQPAWNGVGRFEGVLLAMDVRDLPAEPEILI